jgi:hypothetical protein
MAERGWFPGPAAIGRTGINAQGPSRPPDTPVRNFVSTPCASRIAWSARVSRDTRRKIPRLCTGRCTGGHRAVHRLSRGSSTGPFETAAGRTYREAVPGVLTTEFRRGARAERQFIRVRARVGWPLRRRGAPATAPRQCRTPGLTMGVHDRGGGTRCRSPTRYELRVRPAALLTRSAGAMKALRSGRALDPPGSSTAPRPRISRRSSASSAA